LGEIVFREAELLVVEFVEVVDEVEDEEADDEEAEEDGISDSGNKGTSFRFKFLQTRRFP
jgi:hypothetical protein